MKKISFAKMEELQGGDAIGGFCGAVAFGSLVYAGLVATNFYNPVGWVSATFLVADIACAAYSIASS